MTIELGPTRIAVILLFSITFTLIGWVAPVVWYTYTPNTQIMDVHEFVAEDTTINSDAHYICFDRTVKQPSSGHVFAELYLLDGNGHRIEVDSSSMERYFQSGRDTVITPFDLPNDLTVGNYRYLLIIQLNLADGRVERDFTYQSEPFNISDDQDEHIERRDIC